MKVKKSELKTCKCAYLYADGHMVLKHEKNDPDAGTISWVTIYEHTGVKSYFSDGRLIVDAGALPFLLHASAVECKAATIKGGSDNTRRENIAVGSVTLRNGLEYSGLTISTFPGLISCDFTYQPETPETFEEIKEAYSWCGYNVKTVYHENTD